MRHRDLKTCAAPILDAMKNSMPETFGLAAVDEKKALGSVLYSVEGPDRFCFNIAEGFVFPLHTSAPAKAFIAALPEKRRQNLMARLSFKRYTPNTITTRKRFEKELARTRAAGYALDLSEETVGCHCGGVAVLGPDRTPVAALWISGIDKRLPSKKLRTCIRRLQGAARQLEQALARKKESRTAPNVFSLCVAAAREKLAAYPQRPADYAALARSAGVSYSTLRTAFRTETGMTLGQYRLGLRMAEASRLLRQTSLPVSAVAEHCGFCNQKHFSTLFKHKTGISPLACRKQGLRSAAGPV